MATYYKYAERDASSQVNWAEITSNMVNSLKEVEAIRESKRQAIDDATTELSRTLSEAPQGEHSGLNEFAMTYANNAQQMRLMQDQLLKSGQLKLKDYNIGRANLTEGTTQLFNLGKKYQAVYKEKMDRFKNGESGLQEQFQMAELEAFANFSNHEAYINPTNGQVSVGKLINEDRDGKTVRTMDKTPGSFITVQELNFSVSQKVDKYKLDGLDADVDRLAKKYVKTFGPNFSIDDVRQLPEFKRMKQDMINAQMATGEQNIGSMLADYVKIAPNGKAYGYTRDPNKQDENTILLVADPGQPGSGRLVPDFSSEIGKKQYKEAEDFIGREIEKQLSRTETERKPDKPSVTEIERGTKLKDDTLAMTNIGDLYYATTQGEVNAAASFLEGIQGNKVRSIQKVKTDRGENEDPDYSIEVIFDDGTTGSYPLTVDGTPVDPITFVESISSSLVPGMKDIDKVIQRTKNLKGKTIKDFQGNTGGFERKPAQEKALADPVLSRNVFLENLTGTTKDGEEILLKDFNDTEEVFVDAFKDVFNQLGLTIEQADITGDVVKILGSDNKEITRISTQYKGSGQKFIDFLKGYLKNVDGGILKELLSQGVIPKIAKGGKPKDENNGTPTTTTCPDGKTYDTITKKCI